MSGRPEARCILSALLVSLLLACGASLNEAPETPAEQSLSETETSTTALASTAAETDLSAPDYLPSTVDLSGCWRMLSGTGFGQGSEFSFYEVGHNSFIFASERRNPRTKLVFRGDLRFEEVNFDPLKPFFPPEYIHSSGTLSEDGDTLDRVFADGNNPHRYRRCELVPKAPPGVLPEPGSSLAPLPDQAPQPVPQVTPLLPPEASAAPDAEASIAPLQPDESASPDPEASPTANPLLLRPTPSPIRTPLFEQVVSPEPAPSASPETEPDV